MHPRQTPVSGSHSLVFPLQLHLTQVPSTLLVNPRAHFSHEVPVYSTGHRHVSIPYALSIPVLLDVDMSTGEMLLSCFSAVVWLALIWIALGMAIVSMNSILDTGDPSAFTQTFWKIIARYYILKIIHNTQDASKMHLFISGSKENSWEGTAHNAAEKENTWLTGCVYNNYCLYT